MSPRYVSKNRNRDQEKYNLKKLKNSLYKAGADKNTVKEVCDEILYSYPKDIISSRDIHNLAIRILRKRSPIVASNYNLKKGIEKLGPSGYPFEILCGEILERRGYKIKVGVTIAGQFVTHEVDVLGEREDKIVMCECKFHNYPNFKNDIKIPLYIHSRALDINANQKSLSHDEFVIFSNTKFSIDAQKYAKGVGLRLISLSDNDENVLGYIRRYKTYPITCLLALNNKEAKLLLEKNIVTIRQLEKKIKVLNELSFDEKKIKRIKDEISLLKR